MCALTGSYYEGGANGQVTGSLLGWAEKWVCQQSLILKASSWAALIFVHIPGSLPGGPEPDNTGQHIAQS